MARIGPKEIATRMGWKSAAAGLLAAALAVAVLPFDGPALAQAPAANKPPAEGKAPETIQGIYQHPVRRFTVPVPRGAQISEPDNASRVVIDSRHGYRVIIQANDINPKIILSEMNEKFESQYLGQGKPLSLKLYERPVTVAGLEAIEAKYEGAGSLAKLVMMRGVKSDFVFMFFAPRERFEVLDREFQWLLDNFQPNPADHPATAARPEKPRPPPGQAVAPGKRFADVGYGYTIQYPGDWEVSKPSAAIAAFSGPKGSDSYFVVVSIQNVQPPAAKTPAEATQAALADHKAALTREARDARVIGEQSLIYKNGKLNLAGRQMVVTYTHAGERYRKWTVVVPRPDGAVVHIWDYTAPEKRFDDFRSIADAMLRSWTIQTDGG